jgi:hypothetical protein
MMAPSPCAGWAAAGSSPFSLLWQQPCCRHAAAPCWALLPPITYVPAHQTCCLEGGRGQEKWLLAQQSTLKGTPRSRLAGAPCTSSMSYKCGPLQPLCYPLTQSLTNTTPNQLTSMGNCAGKMQALAVSTCVGDESTCLVLERICVHTKAYKARYPHMRFAHARVPLLPPHRVVAARRQSSWCRY